MTTYTIVGARTVAGHSHGESVNEDELTGCNIPALLQGGHLAQNPNKTVKVDNSEEK
jgi:hypothetical protein